MIEVKFDNDMFARDARKLHLAHENGLRDASRYTVNELAFLTFKKSRAGLKDHFTLRNAWTKKSISFQKVPPNVKDIDMMESEVGSTLAYMREQEEGISRTARGKHGEPIPTTEASGEGQGAVRRKRVLRKNYLNRLRVARGLYDKAKRQAKNSNQVLGLVVNMAKKERKKIIFWKTLRGKQGLFRIDGDRLPMLYDLSEKRVISKPRPWLSGPTDKVLPMLGKIYGKALFFNLRKYG